MNGTCSNLLTHIKLFADDNSFFSAVNDTSENFESLSNDLCIVSEWTSQWEVSETYPNKIKKKLFFKEHNNSVRTGLKFLEESRNLKNLKEHLNE